MRTILEVEVRMEAEINLIRVGNKSMVRYYDRSFDRYGWADIADTDMAHRIDQKY